MLVQKHTCKLLEHIVLHHVNTTLDALVYNSQHGFRKGLSSRTQLCGIYHEIMKHADQGNTIHPVTLDLTNGFEEVPH